MAITSHNLAFDHRLLSIEELFKQRQYDSAKLELSLLTDSCFIEEYQQGLFWALSSEAALSDGAYQDSLKYGLKGAHILAAYPLHRRYARSLLILSKVYSSTGDLKNAQIRARDAQAAYRRAVDDMGQIDALNELARIAFIRSELKAACQFLDEAIPMAGDNQRKVCILKGNAARVHILTGEWDIAEKQLKEALEFQNDSNEHLSRASNLLSLGFLHIRRREHLFAERSLEEALEVIEANNLKREKIIYLEYVGELAFDKRDLFRAKSLLTEAYKAGMELAPESGLISQSVRRLAEVDLLLDDVDDAMNHAQKALDIALHVGEKSEVASARRVIAEVFAARSIISDALENAQMAVDIAREAGDPMDLARSLLTLAEIISTSQPEETRRVRDLFDEATGIFRKLELDYWLAEVDYKAGVFACQNGDLGRGFQKLSRSERVFQSLSETAKARRVSHFLSNLASQAVALSISDQNQFRFFGQVCKPQDVKNASRTNLDDILNLLVERTEADRAIVISPGSDEYILASNFEMSTRQLRCFTEAFTRLLNEEISSVKPTLLFDARRDPYINEMFADNPDTISSVIVVPFGTSDGSSNYIYLDKQSSGGLKPFSQEALNFAVGSADLVAFKSAEFQREKLLEDNRRLKTQLKEQAAFPNIITQSQKMLDMLNQVRQVVDAQISIAIEGPTGAGKDVLARAIHFNSNRRDRRFISVNCAALPESLLESELFGYKRGAFTGADRDKPGLFEEADGGTFFLDEIADMPLSVQAKILRVLEEKEIVRLGESTPREVDVRIVSATNKDLKEEMAQGRFRQDLYYRLAALVFRLPPLSERKEDIPLLADHFLRESGKKLSTETLQHLVTYDWPGNVRELDNEIKKLILMTGENEIIEADLLADKILDNQSDEKHVKPTTTSTSNVIFNEQYTLYDYLAGHERRFIIHALKERKGVKKHAAALLKIPESTLRLKIKEYDINLDRLDAIN